MVVMVRVEVVEVVASGGGESMSEKCQYFNTLQMREVAVVLSGERSDILEVVVSALVVVALLICILHVHVYVDCSASAIFISLLPAALILLLWSSTVRFSKSESVECHVKYRSQVT